MTEEVAMDTRSVLQNGKAIWEKRIEDHEIHKLINPFSDWWGENREAYRERLEKWDGVEHVAKLTKMEQDYGHCKKGSETERRVKKARDFICNNIIDLCQLINANGVRQSDGTLTITFGELFRAYERINDKLVGLLCRARRHNLLTFPGEMLYQRQDEDVIIRLFKVPTFNELKLRYIEFEGNKKADGNAYYDDAADDSETGS